MYDEYISLGDRCEVAFQFRRVLGRESSSFFSWNITPLPTLARLLETRFAGIFELENLRPDEYLVYDKAAHFFFHLQGEGRKSADHPSFPDDVARHKEKAAYLINKLYSDASSGKRIAYFYRADSKDDVRSDIIRVRDQLAKLHGGINFSLVVVQSQNKAEPDWQIEGVYNRYLRRLAADDDQGDGHLQSWDKIFREFPYVQPLRLCDWIY
jgi:hypothetical protein